MPENQRLSPEDLRAYQMAVQQQPGGYPTTGTIEPYAPSPIEELQDYLQDRLMGIGSFGEQYNIPGLRNLADPTRARDIGDKVAFTAEMSPVYGDILGLAEGADLIEEGSPKLGTGIMALSMVPFMPVSGMTRRAATNVPPEEPARGTVTPTTHSFTYTDPGSTEMTAGPRTSGGYLVPGGRAGYEPGAPRPAGRAVQTASENAIVDYIARTPDQTTTRTAVRPFIDRLVGQLPPAAQLNVRTQLNEWLTPEFLQTSHTPQEILDEIGKNKPSITESVDTRVHQTGSYVVNTPEGSVSAGAGATTETEVPTAEYEKYMPTIPGPVGGRSLMPLSYEETSFALRNPPDRVTYPTWSTPLGFHEEVGTSSHWIDRASSRGFTSTPLHRQFNSELRPFTSRSAMYEVPVATPESVYAGRALDRQGNPLEHTSNTFEDATEMVYVAAEGQSPYRFGDSREKVVQRLRGTPVSTMADSIDSLLTPQTGRAPGAPVPEPLERARNLPVNARTATQSLHMYQDTPDNPIQLRHFYFDEDTGGMLSEPPGNPAEFLRQDLRENATTVYGNLRPSTIREFDDELERLQGKYDDTYAEINTLSSGVRQRVASLKNHDLTANPEYLSRARDIGTSFTDLSTPEGTDALLDHLLTEANPGFTGQQMLLDRNNIYGQTTDLKNTLAERLFEGDLMVKQDGVNWLNDSRTYADAEKIASRMVTEALSIRRSMDKGVDMELRLGELGGELDEITTGYLSWSETRAGGLGEEVQNYKPPAAKEVPLPLFQKNLWFPMHMKTNLNSAATAGADKVWFPVNAGAVTRQMGNSSYMPARRSTLDEGNELYDADAVSSAARPSEKSYGLGESYLRETEKGIKQIEAEYNIDIPYHKFTDDYENQFIEISLTPELREAFSTLIYNRGGAVRAPLMPLKYHG
jgi:hypothetical protein